MQRGRDITMRSSDDVQDYANALMKIVQHPKCECVARWDYGQSRKSSNCFLVNRETPIYFKVSRKRSDYSEHTFSFDRNLIEQMVARADFCVGELDFALICVTEETMDGVCLLPWGRFSKLIDLRKEEEGGIEDSYSFYVKVEVHKSFRVNISPANRRKQRIGVRYKGWLTIPRRDFPNAIFDHGDSLMGI
jgi:hypothetical protein